jgi:hypothetical protein
MNRLAEYLLICLVRMWAGTFEKSIKVMLLP